MSTRTVVYKDLLCVWIEQEQVLHVWCPAAPSETGKKLGPSYELKGDDYDRILAMEAFGATEDEMYAALKDIVVQQGYVPWN